MGYRLGGGQSYRVISRLNGINHLDMLIDYALTGVMCDEKTEERINPFFNKQGFILILIIKPGRIKKIQGLSKISKIPQVVNVMQAYKEGDLIPPSAVGTTRQGFGRIHLVANTKEEMADAIAKIKESLFIEDCKGESMLLDTFDERRLLAGSSLYPVKAPGVPMPISPTLL
jgi:predicted CoA-binding protein